MLVVHNVRINTHAVKIGLVEESAVDSRAVCRLLPGALHPAWVRSKIPPSALTRICWAVVAIWGLCLTAHIQCLHDETYISIQARYTETQSIQRTRNNAKKDPSVNTRVIRICIRQVQAIALVILVSTSCPHQPIVVACQSCSSPWHPPKEPL